MYCPKCGKIVNEGGKFCPYCGEPLENNSSTNNFSNNRTNRDNLKNTFKFPKKNKGFLKNTSTKRKCCYVFLILLIVFAIVYIPYVIEYNTNRENVSSFHQDELDALDLDGDGYLTFDEAKAYGNKSSESALLQLFNESDHNGNGLLKGDEFDIFIYKVYKYEHPPAKKTEKKNNTNSSSNSSSPSYTQNPDGDWEEVDDMVGYDSMGYPIYVSYYYTSGNLNMEPGVYRYVGNEYSGYDIEYVSSDWKHEYKGDW